MPNCDGTGPLGTGPRWGAGCRAGNNNPGMGLGQRNGGRGAWCRNFPADQTTLERQAEVLQARLDAVKRRMNDKA